MPPFQIILDWVNLTLLATGIFFAGVVWNRVTSIQERLEKLSSVVALETKVDDLADEMRRIRDRLDKFIDSAALISKAQCKENA